MRVRIRPGIGTIGWQGRWRTRRGIFYLVGFVVLLLTWTRWFLALKTSGMDVRTSTSHVSCIATRPQKVVLFITPGPETETESMFQAYPLDGRSGVSGHIHVVNLDLTYDTDRTLVGSEKLKTWKDPPDWFGLGFTERKDLAHLRAAFEVEACAIITKEEPQATLAVHTPFLHLTVHHWLEFLASIKVPAEIVFARRETLQGQVFAALDHLRAHRISAAEYVDFLQRRVLPDIDRLLGVVEVVHLLERRGNTWKPSPQVHFTHEYDDTALTEQRMLREALSSVESVSDPVGAGLYRREDEAYVSIITASKPLLQLDKNGAPILAAGVKGSDGRESEYTMGIIGLGRSISFFDATRERILMVTDTPMHDEEALSIAAYKGGWTIMKINPIQDRWFSPKCPFAPTRSHQNIRWGLMASKLRIMELREKRALLYMDLDIVVTGRVQRLFTIVPSHYVMVSEGGLQHHYLNAGFLFARPSATTFANMLHHYETKDPPRIFRNLIDCTEMGLINVFFGVPDTLKERGDVLVVDVPSPDAQPNGRTARLPLNSTSLYIGRPDVKMSTMPLAYHFIRKDLCPKPWSVRCPLVAQCKGTPQADQSAECQGHIYSFRKCDRKPYEAWCRFSGFEP